MINSVPSSKTFQKPTYLKMAMAAPAIAYPNSSPQHYFNYKNQHLTHSFTSPVKSLGKQQSPSLRRKCYCKAQTMTERGHEFEVGESFYRHESTTGRDLGVLAASLYKRVKGQLRVLDAMCGCGIRSLRYLVEAKADFLVANDGNDFYRKVILNNLRNVKGDERRWVVTHFDANRLLTEHYLQKDFLDFIDLDSFGSDSMFIRSAMNALRLDGLLYVTSTDGFSAGGHRPYCSLAAYGAYIRPMPYPNEIGLRMLIGGAVREASVLGYHVTPLFSYYAYHGPVFRVLLRMNRTKLPDERHYGFISYCSKCGNSQSYSWKDLGQINCCCCSYEKGPRSIVSGPMWIGPLHSGDYLREMLELTKTWGWTANGAGTELEKILNRMIEESDPQLPAGYINMDEMASRAKVNSPSLETMMTTLRKQGYATSRTHIASNAFKTDCPMTECIKLAKELSSC